MRSKLFPVFLLLFNCLTLSTKAQNTKAYFSVSTNKTFLPGEKVGIRVYSTNVEALEFRVYRVKDPIAFFERLDNVHNFGRVTSKEKVENPSFLESFQDWKRELWVEIRDFFRMQFSARSRAQIRKSQAETRKSKTSVADIFAQVPVLNRSQLVARWRQEMPPRFYSETAQIPVPSLEKGVYLVEATDGTLRAYTVVMVTELGAVTKTAPGQALVFTADRRSGTPIPNADVRIWSDKKQNAQLKSDASGLAQAALPEGQYQDVRVLAVRGDDVAVVTPYSYNFSSNPQYDWTGYVYTDRPVYRPGHTVQFKVILRTRSGERYKVPSGEQVQVLIEDPTSKPMLQNHFAVSSFGTVHGDQIGRAHV